jgi:hypothetical protein
VESPEQRLIEPRTPEDRAALATLLRLRSEGRELPDIAARLRAQTGFDLELEALDRVLRTIAGPAPQQEGGDPAYFSGYLGGG